MRAMLLFLALGAGILAASVAASLVLLSLSRGEDRIGRLSPVAPLTEPGTTTGTGPAAPAPNSPAENHHGGDSSDD